MKDGWKKAAGIGAFGLICYWGGHENGRAPEGSEKPTTVMARDLGDTVGGLIHENNQTAQTILGEAGALTARAGNAATSAGNGVQEVPGAPPAAG